MDPGVASGATVYFGLLPPRRRRQGPLCGHPRALHVLRRPQISPNTHESRPTVGSRYVLCGSKLFTEKARLSTVYHLKIVKVYQINTLWHIARLVEYQCSESCAGAGRARLCEPLPSDGTCAACPRLHSTPRHIRPLIR